MTDNEFNMIMESLVERYNNGEITYEEASKVEDKVRANYAKDKAAKRAAKQQKREQKIKENFGNRGYKRVAKSNNKFDKSEDKKREISDEIAKLKAQVDPSNPDYKIIQKVNKLEKKLNGVDYKEKKDSLAYQNRLSKDLQRYDNRMLRARKGTKNYLAAKANQAKNSAAGAVSTSVHNVIAAKNKLFKAHESALDDFDKTRLEVFEAYENGVINEAEKYELLNTLESAGEFGDYPTEDMLYKDAQPEKIFSQVEDRQAINNPVSALNSNAVSSYDDTTSINPEFDDYSVKPADKEIVTKESVKLDIFDAYEAGEITEADKYELLAMVD
jgi:hypothetical protein